MKEVTLQRNINKISGTGYSNASRIVRTEGHRIQQQSAADARKAAKAKGADVVKQWDSTLDGKTRETHRMLDGQIREIDEDFEANGMKASEPGAFGDPAEDCNCRCVALTRARWALDEDELKTLQDRAEFFGLDKSKDFEDFKSKYLKAAENEQQYGIQYGKATKNVDWDVINSDEYKSKFSNVTNNLKTNETLYNTVKDMLKHCDGTEHEDMYLFDMKGNELGKVLDSVSTLGINYTNEFKNALSDSIKNNVSTIAIHNHPHGTPPSPDDFMKAYENSYKIALIPGHNG